MVHWGTVFVTMTAASFLLGRRELPKIGRFVGLYSGRSVGAIIRAKKEFFDATKDNDLVKLQREFQRGIEELNEIRSELTSVGSMRRPLQPTGAAPSTGSNGTVNHSAVALNTTLNELLGHVLQPSVYEFTSDTEDTSQPWIETFIDKTEEHELFGNDTLYRRTTGFHGDLAFNVSMSDKDPPNVLVIVIESFRYHDSHYLVGEEDPSNLFKGSNITITPNFDKWAKRGIALRNYWSSWRTSRSVESLMFGQLPYDSVTKSGMTGDYDNWDTFLPAHGFDTVWSRDEMKKLAESDLGINHSDWDGPEHRGLNWGVHDDVSFQLLGDLLVNKTKAQVNRVAKGEAKKPLFLNHYTISSHVDYKQRPKWYDRAEKPDFSALYEGQEYSHNIKNYLEMRYFTDMELGKFMDRMDRAGILNDTIVVITGDHGQGPEFGNDVPEDRDVSVTRVGGAIVAEGRLGNAVGMIIDDATEQYDILNTLADITGVPEGGFVQD
ncbi:Sulfatase-like protein, partial [Phytophthora palmivora]